MVRTSSPVWAAVCAVAGIVPSLRGAGGTGVGGGERERVHGVVRGVVAYLAQTMDRTAVSRLMGISWQTVGSIVERVVARQLDPARLHGLKRILDGYGTWLLKRGYSAERAREHFRAAPRLLGPARCAGPSGPRSTLRTTCGPSRRRGPRRSGSTGCR